MQSRFHIFLSIILTLLIASPASAATRSKKTVRKATRPDATDYLASATQAATVDGVPRVNAASVVVIDARTGQVLHEKNPDQHRPPASTQKLLTALIVAEAGDLDAPVSIETSDTWAEPTKLGFKPGDVYTRRALLQVLLVHSMNDVARCLARDNAGSIEAFAAKMNRRALMLGLTDSHFVNPNGLPAPGQYSTARDMSRIARAAYANNTIRSIVAMKTLAFRYADGHLRVFENTNRVLKAYALCNGMKTGYTEAAGKCLIASGATGGRDIIVVVLGDSVKTIWRDAYLLLAWGLAG